MTTIQAVHAALQSGSLTYREIVTAIFPLIGHRSLSGVQNACKALEVLGCAENTGDPSLARIRTTDVPLPMAERKPGGKGHGLRVNAPRPSRAKAEEDLLPRVGRPTYSSKPRPKDRVRVLRINADAPEAIRDVFADPVLNAAIAEAMIMNNRFAVVRAAGEIVAIGGYTVPVGSEIICIVKQYAYSGRWYALSGTPHAAWRVE